MFLVAWGIVVGTRHCRSLLYGELFSPSSFSFPIPYSIGITVSYPDRGDGDRAIQRRLSKRLPPSPGLRVPPRLKI